MISPYAKQGYIDHQTLSFDAYVKFIEDDFLHRQRLDPGTNGRPDHRLDVREDAPILGNLVNDFDLQSEATAAAAPPRIPACPGPAVCAGHVHRRRDHGGRSRFGHRPSHGNRPHATNLQGQTLVIAITPTTTILLNNQPAQATGPQTGQSVSGRIQKTAGGYTATELSAQRP